MSQMTLQELLASKQSATPTTGPAGDPPDLSQQVDRLSQINPEPVQLEPGLVVCELCGRTMPATELEAHVAVCPDNQSSKVGSSSGEGDCPTCGKHFKQLGRHKCKGAPMPIIEPIPIMEPVPVIEPHAETSNHFEITTSTDGTGNIDITPEPTTPVQFLDNVLDVLSNRGLFQRSAISIQMDTPYGPLSFEYTDLAEVK